MSWNDEIVEEVRRVREAYAAKFDYDVSAICADIRRRQAESRRKIVSLKRKNAAEKSGEIQEAELLKVA